MAYKHVVADLASVAVSETLPLPQASKHSNVQQAIKRAAKASFLNIIWQVRVFHRRKAKFFYAKNLI